MLVLVGLEQVDLMQVGLIVQVGFVAVAQVGAVVDWSAFVRLE